VRGLPREAAELRGAGLEGAVVRRLLQGAQPGGEARGEGGAAVASRPLLFVFRENL
jgi:hypothetical protein